MIAVAGAVLIAYVATREPPQASVEVGTLAPSSSGGAPVSEDVGVARGAEDAPVVLEEYADYLCPYCGMVARLTIPGIVERYVETGKVRYMLFDFPVHGDKAYLGAEAARCAGEQGAYWKMSDVLFGRMSEWGEKRDPRRAFQDYAEALGLDARALKECVDARKYREVVQASRRRGEQLGIRSTPTFIVNGRRMVGAMGFDQMAAAIEAELEN